MIDEQELIKVLNSGAYEIEVEAPAAHEKTVRAVASAYHKTILQIIEDQPKIIWDESSKTYIKENRSWKE